MTVIKRIIEWFINLFKKIFGKKKISKKIKSSINRQSNKHYFKEYGLDNGVFNTTFPIYLMIDNEMKEELINQIKLMEKKIEKENIDNKVINNIIKEIKTHNISFYQKELINEKIGNVLEDKEIEIDANNKILSLDKEVMEIIENYDKTIKEKAKKEYDIVNYVTITTLLIDETDIEIKKLEEDFHHHRYNKYYYERQLKKIKMRIDNLRKLRKNNSVQEEIQLLKKDLYTKKKDKYDLLYNDEVFLNIEKICDDLLKKVNRRIIDLKKEKEEKVSKERIKKEEKKKNHEEKKEKRDELREKNELLENILKRYQDMELARKILLLLQNNQEEFNKDYSILKYVNSLFFDFVNGEKFKFNYERNKIKLELVKLINNMEKVNCLFDNSEFIPFEHINYSMIDLVDLASTKKKDLDELMEEKYNYQKEKDETSILVDNKLGIIREKELGKEEKAKVLVKTNNEKK